MSLLFSALGGMAQSWCTLEREDELTLIRLPQDARLLLTDERPQPDDATTLLCIAAAFTSPQGTVEGAYTIGGRMHNRYNRHSKVSLSGRTFTLGQQFSTPYGFQQMCLVRNGQAVHFRDEKRRVRRALCKESARGEALIVESRRSLTMNEFAQLLAQRMHSAVYTDMGSFGYGWVRTADGLHHLRSFYSYNKKKQTNWLVVRRSAH